MKVSALLFLSLPLVTSSFGIPTLKKASTGVDTFLTATLKDVNSAEAFDRRNVLNGGLGLCLAAVFGFPLRSGAFTQETYFLDDNYIPSSQLSPTDKVDVNSAFVGEYKQFRGMYPHAAGKIASHGPYQSIRDIYNIEGLTKNDLELFKTYESELTCLPPTTVSTYS